MIDVAVTELEPFTSVKRACELLGKSRATLHRQRNPEPAAEKAPPGPRAPHPAALTGAEQAALLAVLDSERFADKSPAQVYAILLDDGIYLASIRTMYRVMTLADQVPASAAPRPPIRPGSAPSWSLTARTRLSRSPDRLGILLTDLDPSPDRAAKLLKQRRVLACGRSPGRCWRTCPSQRPSSGAARRPVLGDGRLGGAGRLRRDRHRDAELRRDVGSAAGFPGKRVAEVFGLSAAYVRRCTRRRSGGVGGAREEPGPGRPPGLAGEDLSKPGVAGRGGQRPGDRRRLGVAGTTAGRGSDHARMTPGEPGGQRAEE